MRITYHWRGRVNSGELNELHADAFDHRVFADDQWDWSNQIADHSFGWVTARHADQLVGFVNVISDGLVHAWIQDVVVASHLRHEGVGRTLVETATAEVSCTSHEWLHVDFDQEMSPFYIDACGFLPTSAGLIDLTQQRGPAG